MNTIMADNVSMGGIMEDTCEDDWGAQALGEAHDDPSKCIFHLFSHTYVQIFVSNRGEIPYLKYIGTLSSIFEAP